MGVVELRRELLDEALPIPQRFRALFALRSISGDAAVGALLDGLKDPSALFRHEVAFALGQMQVEAAVPALKAMLRDVGEHSMAWPGGNRSPRQRIPNNTQDTAGVCMFLPETTAVTLSSYQNTSKMLVQSACQ
jgi:hypothetical protein